MPLTSYKVRRADCFGSPSHNKGLLRSRWGGPAPLLHRPVIRSQTLINFVLFPAHFQLIDELSGKNHC